MAIETPPQDLQGLAAALVRAQRRIRSIPTDGINEHHRYRYATAESMISSCRAALSSEGLACIETSQTWEVLDAELGILHTEHLLVHESGVTLALPPRTWPVIPGRGRPWDKAVAGASTAAMSYFLRGLLMVPRGADDSDVEQRDDTSHVPTPIGDLDEVRKAFDELTVSYAKPDDESRLQAALEARDRPALSRLYVEFRNRDGDRGGASPAENAFQRQETTP